MNERRRPAAELAHFDETTFEAAVLRAGVPALVQFGVERCATCGSQAALLEELAVRYARRAVFGRVDVERSAALAALHRVEGTPTLVLFRNGKALARKVGPARAEELTRMVDAALPPVRRSRHRRSR